MFNQSELEGEVDHSFFDSDCDDRDTSRDGAKKMEKGLKAEKAKQNENTKGVFSPRNDGGKKHLKPLENNSGSRAERKEKNYHSKEDERRRPSSESPVACASEKVIKNRSDSEEESNLQYKRSNGTFMALLAEGKETDYKETYSQSSNESEEDELPSNPKYLVSKVRNKSPKKRVRNRRTRSPSPTSTEASVDADSESSCSSSVGRSSLEFLTPKPNKSTSSQAASRTRAGSIRSQDVPVSHMEESEDTVTDVSPLSSPDSSPLQSLNLNHTEAEEESLKEQHQEERVPSSGLSNIHQDEDSDHDVDDCSLSSECQLGDKLLFRCPGGRNRKNYSFTNDEVRNIDRENQRLLRELSRLSPGPRPASTARKKTHMISNSPIIRVSHSALNRQREQQRIERENLAFLKRLESVKPTPALKRSQQLADYQRQVGYLGAPSYQVCMPTKKERSTSQVSSASPRPISSVHQSSRAVSTTSDPSSTPVPRSKKPSAAQPAWC